MRSWIKPSPFEGTASKFLFDTIKSIQRRISAPKIIDPAEVNCDNELPDQSCKHFLYLHFYLSSIDATNLQICRDLKTNKKIDTKYCSVLSKIVFLFLQLQSLRGIERY